MVKTIPKPSHPFSWKRHNELHTIKDAYRIKRCKELGSEPPKPKPKERRQS